MASRFDILLKTYATMQRYRQIMFVLLKYGFEDLIVTLGVEEFLGRKWSPLRKKMENRVAYLARAARIRMALQELGPTFVKMGQALSTRSDMLPEDILAELIHLQDQVPSFPVDEVKRIIERELGHSCQELFASFDVTPLAAGSIGQVHRARLKDGSEVVIKVQRPGIRRKILVDLEIIHHLAGLMERHLELGQVHKPTAIVDEFSRTLTKELDYFVEAANIDRFNALFSDHPHIYVHRLYREHSSRHVLTLEYIKGHRPSNVEGLKMAGLNPTEIAARGAHLLMEQVFKHGFFHADPHPGNLLIMEKNVICFLDFGMVGRIDRDSREQFAELLAHVVARDEVRTADVLLKLTHSHSLVDRLLLEREISELIDQYLYRPLKELELGPMIRAMMDLTVRHDLRIPASFFLLIKSLTQIEDLGRNLSPDFDFSTQLAPFIRELLMQRYKPQRVARQVYDTLGDLIYLLREVPGELRELLKQARGGKFKIELEHLGLKPLRGTMEKVSNRISSAIVLGSLIVGSSVIVHSGVPPKWHDIPVIGLAGYLISMVMGFSLLRSIMKS